MMMQVLDLINYETHPELDSDMIFNLEIKIMAFKRLCNPDFDLPQEAKVYLLDARRELNTALMIIRQSIEPEENEYIRDNKKAFDWLVDNLGRFDKRLDEKEKEIMDVISREKSISGDDTKSYEVINFKAVDASALRKLNSYKRELEEAMEMLVFYPLINSIKKFNNLPNDFKNKEGLPAQKDKKLLNYFLFCYLFNSSNILGGMAREESPKSVRTSLSTSGSTSGSGVEMLMPPSMPENLRIKEKDQAFKDSLNKYFDMPEELKEAEDGYY